MSPLTKHAVSVQLAIMRCPDVQTRFRNTAQRVRRNSVCKRLSNISSCNDPFSAFSKFSEAEQQAPTF